MERGSTKHAAQLDESMAAEEVALAHGAPVEGRTDERGEAGQVDAVDLGSDIRDDVPEPATPAALPHEQVTARSEIARFIPPSTYPASVDELLAAARADGATEAVLAALERLDSNRHYDTAQQIWEALGGEIEHRPRDAETEAATGRLSSSTSQESRAASSPSRLDGGRPTGPRRRGLRVNPSGAVRFGFDLAALATRTIARTVSDVARHVDQLRERIADGSGGS